MGLHATLWTAVGIPAKKVFVFFCNYITILNISFKSIQISNWLQFVHSGLSFIFFEKSNQK